MNLIIKTIIDEYNSITDDKTHVIINGREFIDTILMSRKDRLLDSIFDAAIYVMRKQIEISESYAVSHPYDRQLEIKHCSYKIIEKWNDKICICFKDVNYDRPDKYTETILFDDIINFDEKQYTLKCINIRIKRAESEIQRYRESISKLNDFLDDMNGRKSGIEMEIAEQETNKLIND